MLIGSSFCSYKESRPYFSVSPRGEWKIWSGDEAGFVDPIIPTYVASDELVWSWNQQILA